MGSREQEASRGLVLAPGEVVTELVLRLGLEAGGRAPAPRGTADGVRLELPRRRGRVLVRASAEGSRVTLVGRPPPWPLSAGWARRRLGRLLAGLE